MGAFFIISGFFLLPKKTEQFKIKQFLIKKILRLYPSYFLCITLTFISVSLFGLNGRETNFLDYILNACFINGFIGVNYVDGAHWYITYLIIFYVIISIVLKFSIKSKIFLPGWIITKDTLKVATHNFPVVSPLYKIIGGDYVEFIVIGITLSELIESYNIDNRVKNLWIYYAVMVLSVIQIIFTNGITTGVFIILFLIIFILAIHKKLTILERIKLLYILGTISYVLYLLHQNIGYQIILGTCNRFGTNYIGFYIIITILVICVISYMINKYYEKNIQNYISKKLEEKNK